MELTPIIEATIRDLLETNADAALHEHKERAGASAAFGDYLWDAMRSSSPVTRDAATTEILLDDVVERLVGASILAGSQAVQQTRSGSQKEFERERPDVMKI